MRISVSDLIASIFLLWTMFSVQAETEPQILQGPTNTTAFVDSSLTMTCQASGSKLSYQWYKRSSAGRWILLEKSDRYKIFKRNGTLLFNRILGSDSGFYKCTAYASATKITVDSSSAYLDVQAKAHIVNGLKDISITWGVDLTLECEVVGIPFPNRTWSKNGILIMDQRSGKPYEAARLVINATETATYTCTAQNRHLEGITNVSSEAVVRVTDGRCVPYTGSVCHKYSTAAVGDAEDAVSQHSLRVTLSSVHIPARLIDPISEIDSALLRLLDNMVARSTNSCYEAAIAVLCRHAFPDCIGVGVKLRPKPLCRETCTALADQHCTVDWSQMEQSSSTLFSSLQNCSSLPSVTDGPAACSFVDLSDLQPAENKSGVLVTAVVVVSASVVLVVAAIVVGQVVLVRHRRRQPRSTTSARHRHRVPSSQRPDASDVFIDVDQLPMNDAYDHVTMTSTHSALDPQCPRLSRLECDRNAIAYCKDKSNGAFGSVFVATFNGSSNGFTSATNVVVKTLRPDVDDAARRDFIRAGELVAGLSHPNIIRVVGACLQSEPICLIFEHMAGGELCDYLRVTGPRHHIYRDGEARLVAFAELISIARQIADAMVYFSGCGYVHRDLAARNCLVSEVVAPDTPIVKLADFGLAVQLDDQEFYRGADDEEIPVRWMPPEAIVESRFAPASDVWSFAVLTWEVFSFGAKPYDGLSSLEAARRIVTGKILERPDLTSSVVYDLMRLCWNADPSKRPNFETVHQRLVDLERRACARVVTP